MLELLDVKSLPTILINITAELKEKLPENDSFEDFRYVYLFENHCTPRILFEFSCLDSGERGCRCAVMLGGVFPEMPLRKLSRHLLAGTRKEIINYFERPDAPQVVMEEIEKLDMSIRLHD